VPRNQGHSSQSLSDKLGPEAQQTALDWSLSRGLPLAFATALVHHIFVDLKNFTNEGNIFYKIRLENGEYWSANEKEEHFPTMALALAACNEFLSDAKEGGLDYSEDDIEIFEVTEAGVYETTPGLLKHDVLRQTSEELRSDLGPNWADCVIEQQLMKEAYQDLEDEENTPTASLP
jgi:hypothetical protein